MLHKSFKPAKCKTALKLAASRIKLLKNKREAQLRQLKGEVAQLLAAGQDQTARIRVEHVVREEKTMAAYELIEIYCELIAARLPIIESQKICPIDLKEAVTSVIFASPRCADIPELTDVRKHLSAKYGKEFTSSALELRPDCGVSRLLVEKMSVKAPDGPTKMKILIAIAEEHNVKWDPNLFEERYNQAPSDLLNGPSSFQGDSNTPEKLPPAQQPVNYSDGRQSDFQGPAGKDDTDSNSHALDSRTLAQSDRLNNNFNTGTSRPDLSHSGGGAGNAEIMNSDQYTSGFSSRQNWSMEFKDATAAAQAAAESAERASMAARAAAELSSQGRNSRQYSEGSNKSPTFGSGDQRHQDITGTETNQGRNSQGRNSRQYTEGSKKSSDFGSGDQRFQDITGSTVANQHLKKGAVNSFSAATPQMHDGLRDGEEQDDLADLTARFYNLKNSDNTSSSAPSKSSSGSVENFSNVNNSPKVEKYSQSSSSEAWRSQLSGGAGESSQSDSNARVKDGIVSGNIGSIEEPDIRTQHSSGSLHSPSGSVTGDHNILVDHHKSEEDIENPFAVDGDGNTMRSQEDTGSYQNDTAFFDDSGSEEDVINLDAIEEHNVHRSSSYLIPGRNMNDSKEKYSSSSLFSSEDVTLFPEKTSHEVAFHSDSLSPVAFDESDGSGSESEEELPASGLIGSGSTGGVLQKERESSRILGDPEPIRSESPAFMRSSFAEREKEEPGRDTSLQQASHDLDDAEVVHKRNLETVLSVDRHTKLSYGSSETRQPSSRQLNSQSNTKDVSHDLQVSGSSSASDEIQRYDILEAAEDDYSVFDSGRGSGKELSFGKLSGGFKNKGYQHPPYLRKPSTNSLAAKEPTADGLSRTMDQLFSSKSDGTSGNSRAGRLKVNPLARSENTAAYSDSSDDSSDEQPKQDLTTTQAPSNYRLASKGGQKPDSRSFFDSDDSDAEENCTEQNLTRRTHVGAAMSLRTKASLATPDRKSSSRSKVVSESPSSGNYDLGTPSRRNANSKPRADPKLTSNSDNNVVSDHSLQDQSTARPLPPSKFSPMEPPSKFSQSTGVKQDKPSQPKVSDYSIRQKPKRSDEAAAAASKPFPGPNRSSSHEENTKSSAREDLSVPGNSSTPQSAERAARSSSQEELPSTDNNTNRASHVHPKLPDYDTLTAKLLALRQNRQ